MKGARHIAAAKEMSSEDWRRPSSSRCPVCGGFPVGHDLAARDENQGLPGTFIYSRCPQCRLLFQDSSLSHSQVINFYRNPSPAAKALEPGWLKARVNSRANRFRAATIQRHVGSGSLLDIGCGKGFFLSYMQRFGWRSFGIEASSSDIDFAVDHLKLEGIHLAEWPCALPQNKQFDVITMFHVVEHFYDPVAALAAVSSQLKPSGILVLETPNLESWPARIFGKYWVALDAPRHRAIFSKAGLMRCLQRTGFHVLSLETYSPSTMEYRESLRYVLRSWAHQRAFNNATSLRTGGAIDILCGMRSCNHKRPTLRDWGHASENIFCRSLNAVADQWGRGCNLLLIARLNTI
jgi:2-polyprenyl-3-methyl-5-hydroxy-6-metoxy-1,4-benzoquinol methylase